VHPVGFTIRIYHDARSAECKMCLRIKLALVSKYICTISHLTKDLAPRRGNFFFVVFFYFFLFLFLLLILLLILLLSIHPDYSLRQTNLPVILL